MKYKKMAVCLTFAALSINNVLAQNVPELPAPNIVTSATTPAQRVLPPVQLLSSDVVPLDSKEAYGVQLANEWKTNPNKPRRAADGSVKYLFGATMPTLVCTPLQVCTIKLQPGEIVNDVHVGDSIRWKITPAQSGVGATATTFVIVKPVDAGITTNLFITTDRRNYTIKLVSTKKDWIPVLSFDYPDDIERAWTSYRNAQAIQVENTTLPTGENLANLNFNFKISGDNPSWKPQRVYTDGKKTYIQFSSANMGGEAPALVALGNDGGIFSKSSEQLVNYRVIGDRYVVDRVLQRAALISGVGRHQVKVIIEFRSR